MKKIITLVTILSGFFANAQYINHSRFLVDVNGGYAIAIPLEKNNFNYDITSETDNKDFSGVFYEASVYYRISFNSNSLVGFKGNYTDVGAKNSTSFSSTSNSIISVDKEREVLFVGPSYMYQTENLIGTKSNFISLTPGFMMLNYNFIQNNQTTTFKGSGFGFNLAFGSSINIIEPLSLSFKMGFTYANIEDFSISGVNTNNIKEADLKKIELLRLEPTLGLKMKL